MSQSFRAAILSGRKRDRKLMTPNVASLAGPERWNIAPCIEPFAPGEIEKTIALAGDFLGLPK